MLCVYSMVTLSEVDCVPSGFLWLSRFHTQRSLLYPCIKEAILQPIKEIKAYDNIKATMFYKSKFISFSFVYHLQKLTWSGHQGYFFQLKFLTVKMIRNMFNNI